MERTFEDTEVAFRYKSYRELRLSYYLFRFISSQWVTQIGTRLVQLSLVLHLPLKGLLRRTIFRQFCGGETLTEAGITAKKLSVFNVDTILDYGVEGKESEFVFDEAVPEFINAINFAAKHSYTPFVSLKITGFARFGLLENISAGRTLSAVEKAEWERVHKRIDQICSCASEKGIMILIDAEETWILEACNELTEAMMEKYNKTTAVVFNTFQLYCSGTLEFLKESIKVAREKQYHLGAKLVRGAYMEKERQRAKEKGYADPIQPSKQATDDAFDAAVCLCLRNLDNVSLFIGSHNEVSALKAAEWMHSNGIAAGDRRIFFSQLLGMSDHISFNLAQHGYNVSKYMPYGPVKDVIPYLLRRARENTSVSGQTNRELLLLKKEISRRNREKAV